MLLRKWYGKMSSLWKEWKKGLRLELDFPVYSCWVYPDSSFTKFLSPIILRSNPKIVVIGAGVSGITVAVSLADLGFRDVTVLEAEDRIGGRICTVPFGQHHIDLGAHWVHGEEGNAAYELGEPLGLIHPSRDENMGSFVFLSDDGKEITPPLEKELKRLAIASADGGIFHSTAHNEPATLQKGRGPFKTFLESWFKGTAKASLFDENLSAAFIDWLTRRIQASNGCDFVGELSIPGLALYDALPGDQYNSWKEGGYHNIIDILLKQHPSVREKNEPLAAEIVLNAEVTEIQWGGLMGLVKTKDGCSFEADHIIVTVSLGVLKEKYSTLFSPRLPEKKIEAIRGLGFGTVGKIYLLFERPWWPKGFGGFNILSTNKQAPLESGEYNWEREIMTFSTESSSPCVLCGWLVGDAARDMETYSDEQVLAAAYRRLLKVAGSKYKIPHPVDVNRSRWYSNPHFRGSYSHASALCEVLGTSAADLAEPVVNLHNKKVLLFAGEATNSSHFSTVHGALETGRREAERIAAIYRISS